MNTNETIIVMGRSGSGKGTQIKLLKEYITQHHPQMNLVHYESGQAFRNFINAEGYTSELMRSIIESGTLAPDFITEWLLVNSFVKNMTEKDQVLILDGFPRTLNQAYTLDSAMDYYKREHIIVLNFDVSEDEVRTRMKERGRTDDQHEVIESRIQWYNKNVIPTIDYFRHEPQYEVIDIDGEQSIQDVQLEIINKLGL